MLMPFGASQAVVLMSATCYCLLTMLLLLLLLLLLEAYCQVQ
jgi:hypothetical protein